MYSVIFQQDKFRVDHKTQTEEPKSIHEIQAITIDQDSLPLRTQNINFLPPED